MPSVSDVLRLSHVPVLLVSMLYLTVSSGFASVDPEQLIVIVLLSPPYRPVTGVNVVGCVGGLFRTVAVSVTESTLSTPSYTWNLHVQVPLEPITFVTVAVYVFPFCKGAPLFDSL